MMTIDVSIELAGEQIALLPERALYWPRRQMLLVADLHWGKAATFRAAGLAIPPGGTTDDLARLDRALERTGARRLALLGDALHARAGRRGAAFERVAAWRARWPELEITLVRGNHDRGAGDPPPEWRFERADEPCIEAPFVLCHHPHEAPAGYVRAGHLHPAAQLRGAGRQQARLPCFWLGERVGVLPAFGGFTGSALASPRPGDRVFVIADGAVLPVR